MTIRKGEPWGEPAELPAEGILAPADDRAASRSVELALEHGQPLVPMFMGGGDLARTMGGGTPGRLHHTHVRATVDLLQVHADGVDHSAVAHVVARRSWWRGEVVLAMNAQFLGAYDVAPRSHPNDGRVDVLRVDPRMGLRARLQARRRARTGTHLPHPQLAATSVKEWTGDFDPPLRLHLDGTRVGDVRHLRITVVPDALIVHA
ncbi:MAG: hypothetical protein ACOYMR_17335 [Ilumatobacteraceae bacterium]